MTLAIGTALQKGNYVIDALGREDSIGPVYLATHVPSGQWVMVRILGSRHPEIMPAPEQRSRFYQYLVTIGDLGEPRLPERIRGFEEEGVCYQALSMPSGDSLAAIVSPQQPLALDRSLAIIHSLGDLFQSLEPHGWQGLHLTPDQVWLSPDGQHLTFTGLTLPTSTELDHPTTEVTVVQSLTHLLYFLLTGQRAEASQSPLIVDLHHRRPGLAARLDAALQQGCLAASSPITLGDWLALLPAQDLDLDSHNLAPMAAAAPAPMTQSAPAVGAHRTSLEASDLPSSPPTLVVARAASAAATAATSTPARSAMAQPYRRKFSGTAPWALLATGLLAGIGGLALGFYVRLQPMSANAGQGDLESPNGTSATPSNWFNPDQSFPPLPNWRGEDFLPNNDTPSRRQRRPDYGSSPPPVQSAPARPAAPAARETPASAPAATPRPTSAPESREAPAGNSAPTGRDSTPTSAPEPARPETAPPTGSSPRPETPPAAPSPAPAAPPAAPPAPSEPSPPPAAPPPIPPAPIELPPPAPPPAPPAPPAPPPPVVEPPAPLTSS